MPERFEIYIVYKRRYINTLPFLFPPESPSRDAHPFSKFWRHAIVADCCQNITLHTLHYIIVITNSRNFNHFTWLFTWYGRTRGISLDPA